MTVIVSVVAWNGGGGYDCKRVKGNNVGNENVLFALWSAGYTGIFVY